MFDKMTSFADALTAAIRRQAYFEIDKLYFKWRADLGESVDVISTGRHTLIFELPNGKQYRVMVEPVMETHK